MISPAPHPLVLSLSKDEQLVDALPLMVRQAHHERFLIACTTPFVLSLARRIASLVLSLAGRIASLVLSLAGRIASLVLSLSKDEQQECLR